ncbi:MAG: hypothetical protein K0R23_1455 [Lacrimispora sp.]|jgi:hypothetical protein|nr:hypothetical protein [Lacrimispora sp.]
MPVLIYKKDLQDYKSQSYRSKILSVSFVSSWAKQVHKTKECKNRLPVWFSCSHYDSDLRSMI